MRLIGKRLRFVLALIVIPIITIFGFQNCGTNSSSFRSPDSNPDLQTELSIPELTTVNLAIESMSPQVTSVRSGHVLFSISENINLSLVRFQCILNSVIRDNCTSPFVFENLQAGLQSFTVRAYDTSLARLLGESSRSWNIDLTPPQVLINSGPASYTTNRTADIRFTATDDVALQSAYCSLNNQTPTACQGSFLQSGLDLGDYNFKVFAKDMAGNVSAISQISWSIKPAPEISFMKNPLALTNSTSGNFEFAVVDSNDTQPSANCSIDGGAFATCSSPSSFVNLTDGQHRLTIKATNRYGISAEKSYSWTVDLKPPKITFTNKIYSGVVYSMVSSFNLAFSATDEFGVQQVQCAIENNAFSNCSSFVSLSGIIATALQRVQIRVTDNAGNSTTQDLAVTLDSTWPTLNINFEKAQFIQREYSGFVAKSNSFSFSIDASDDRYLASLYCFLNSVPISPCSSGQVFSYSNLPEGRYSFSFSALDGSERSTNRDILIFVDKTSPSAPLQFKMLSSSPFSAPPVASWAESMDSVSGVRYYEISVTRTEAPDANVLMDWMTNGVGLQKQLIWSSMAPGQSFFVHLRAVDNGLNKSIVQSLGPFQLAGNFQINYQKISMPSYYAYAGVNACVIVNGALQCWGGNSYMAMTNQESQAYFNGGAWSPQTILSSDVKDVCVGATSCALTNSGAVKCWGKNVYGETGEKVSTQRTRYPTTVIESGAEAIGCTEYNSCAKLSGGKLVCWGDYRTGLLGGKTSNSFVPSVLFETGVTDFSIGRSSCMIVSGSLYCLGQNNSGEVGDGTKSPRLTPFKVLDGNVTHFSMDQSNRRVCAVQSGSLKCWGESNNGDGTSEARTSPIQIFESGVSKVKIGLGEGCATVGGDLKCWGHMNLSPSQVSVDKPIQDFAVGAAKCSISDAGKLQCWGFDNSAGAVGNGTLKSQLTPFTVFSNGVKAFANDRPATSCAVVESSLRCWGYNSMGSGGEMTSIGLEVIPTDYYSPVYFTTPQTIFPR